MHHSIVKVHQPHQVNAYEPVILAIGPYHHGNARCKIMEEQKLLYLNQLLERRNESRDWYTDILMNMEGQARDCYAETIHLSPEEFVAMMLLDGCFIVELFRRCIMHNLIARDEPLMHDIGIQKKIRRDLLLLENQLPFFVLKKLYDETKGPGDQNELGRHASEYFKVFIQNHTIGEGTKHLLHLYHTWYTSDLPVISRPDCRPVKFSATELRESGVKFRAAQGDKLSDIKFKNGTLEIPVFKVSDHTKSKFQNLIAYEHHCHQRNNNYFMDYVNFMHCLINSSKYVKVLLHAKIIKIYLGDDEVIADMFNKLGTTVSDSYDSISNSYYTGIFKSVNKHCDKRSNVWMVKLRREYFHSPWAFLSVVAAIVLLLLTATQTVYSILSYNK